MVCVPQSSMGAQSTQLEFPQWLALDAGATRIRVAPVVVSPEGLELAGQPLIQSFSSASGPGRVAQAASLLQVVADQQGWTGPFRVALAWAGAPTSDGRGIQAARYGPVIPSLVAELGRLFPLAHEPRVHSDARAALEGAMLGQDGRSAYAALSGSGLGEAFFEQGMSWPRESFLEHFGAASQWDWQGRDAESWLRAESWRPDPGRPLDSIYLEALLALLQHRRVSRAFDLVFLGGHFLEWLSRGWITVGHLQPWGPGELRPLLPEMSLLGSVQMERRRLISSEPTTPDEDQSEPGLQARLPFA